MANGFLIGAIGGVFGAVLALAGLHLWQAIIRAKAGSL